MGFSSSQLNIGIWRGWGGGSAQKCKFGCKEKGHDFSEAERGGSWCWGEASDCRLTPEFFCNTRVKGSGGKLCQEL